MLKQTMDTCSDPGEHQFFDALDEITDSGSEYPDPICSISARATCNNTVSSSAQFDVWTQNPESVQTRRSKFFNWLGLDVNKISGDDSEEDCDFKSKNDRMFTSVNDSLLRKTSIECELSSTRSDCPVSFCSFDDTEYCGNLSPKENVVGEMKGNVGDENRQSGSNLRVRAEKPVRSSSSSSSEGFSPIKNTAATCSIGPTKKVKKWWLNRLRSFNCVMEGEQEPCNCDSFARGKIQRVKVHQSKKQSKELSALYYGQNIRAHKGAILTMKFSPDGRFLASAGEDRIVRVWQVVEDERSNEVDIPDMDPSCVYFTMNHSSELKPLSHEKEKNGKLRRNSDSACVVLPPKVFRISEKPVHEFQGHTSEVLDLSWSKSDCLLSASVDKTVRLWRVGFGRCLQFNPVDENCFISGSIDGKVRIWEISHCKVVNWIETKDIVTAVCYRPDGQGGIIGSIAGSCRFYSISDNQLELDAQIFLHNKKKSSGKWITGFQFFPQDPSKVMISCADSQVRILQGVNVIGKYKGLRRTGAYCTAFFTADGKHIVGASEDSNVYIWKCNDQDYANSSSSIKKIKSSERFLSNASIALPWPGLQNEINRNQWHDGAFNGLPHSSRPFFSPPHFSCRQDFFLELYYPKGSALWPEEKLVSSSPLSLTSSMHKSEYKFLKTCQSRSNSDAWGMVIVTAGWDGRIRSFHNYGLPVPH
ncbi:putative WD repeat-containing protein C3H5.08c [Bienertia sinuspersici]